MEIFTVLYFENEPREVKEKKADGDTLKHPSLQKWED